MIQLILTQAEHDTLRSIRTSERNISVLGILMNELGVAIKIDDDAAAAERALVLADPTLLRKYALSTAIQYYELFLIYDILGADNTEVFQQLMSYVSGAAETGFPIYLVPQGPILEIPLLAAVASTQVIFITNARPLSDVAVIIKDDTATPVGAPILVTADEVGESQFQFVVPAGTFVTLETTHNVVLNAESGNGDVNHINHYYIATA